MALKRFIKKVPVSGGAPSFKLTLPHQVVSTHLLHLVDTEFELAPSASAQQTWQGSIVPRRNRERSEFTLQGWKLFAEAHKVKAGDQVSFELVTPRRLVIQIIKPVDAADPSPAASTSPPDLKAGQVPTKQSSPRPSVSGSCLQAQQQTELWPNDLDGPVDMDDSWLRNFSSSAELRGDLEKENSPRDYLWEAAGDKAARRPPAASEDFPHLEPPASVFLRDNVPLDVAANTLSGSKGTSSSRKRNLSSVMRVSRSASNLYSDLMLAPVENPDTEVPPQLPTLAFQAEDSDGSNVAQPRADVATHLNLQLGNLKATIQSLQTEVQRLGSRAQNAETEMGCLRLLCKKLQRALGEHTREAIRAETGLETTATRLSGQQLRASFKAETGEELQAIQADLSSHLDELRHSLWQLLVLGLENLPEEFNGGGPVRA